MTKNNLITAGACLAVILVGLMVILLIPTKYTITFDTTGGTIMEEVEVKKGTTIGDLDVPTKDGYTFLYWTLDGKECSKTDEITKDMKLTAKWAKNVEVNPEAKKYTITFDSNGGSTINKVKVEEGKTVEEPNSPTKEGHVFVSWMLDNKTFDFNATITKDITLVAKWEKVQEETKTYTVTFNTDGGSKVSSKTVIEGNKVSKPSNPTKSGYTFVKWTLDGKEYNFNSKVTSNITLKATWKKVEEPKEEETPKEEDKPVVSPTKYTVTFETDGGSSVASQTIEENGKISKPADPKKDGYTFVSWTLDGKTYDFNTKVTKNITLKATWKKVEEPKEEDKPVVVPIKYTVTFNSNGGSSVASQTVEDGSKAIKPENPTRSGYTFGGWTLNGSNYDFSSAVKGNITLVAKWTENQKVYTIKAVPKDSFSPDMILTVYEDEKPISVSAIKYTDGVLLCSGSNTAVSKSDISGESIFLVVLTNGTTVRATLV